MDDLCLAPRRLSSICSKIRQRPYRRKDQHPPAAHFVGVAFDRSATVPVGSGSAEEVADVGFALRLAYGWHDAEQIMAT
jgi:hypothetical protein